MVAGNRTIAHGELSSSIDKRSIAMGYKVSISNSYGIFMTTNNNSVGIGTNTTGSYKLAVNGAMTVMV